MTNLSILKRILMSEDEYWIVAKENEIHNCAGTTKLKDSIILICIPHSIRRGLKYEEILLTDLVNLQSTNLNNIYINENYAPFQSGVTLYDVYEGYPIKGNVKEFMLEALSLGSNNIYDYEQVKIEKPEPELL